MPLVARCGIACAHAAFSTDPAIGSGTKGNAGRWPCSPQIVRRKSSNVTNPPVSASNSESTFVLVRVGIQQSPAMISDSQKPVAAYPWYY